MLPISSDGNVARKVALITGISGQVSKFVYLGITTGDNNYYL